jgi:hypothetical protein
LCFLKCASKSLKSQSLNFPLPNKSFFKQQESLQSSQQQIISICISKQ